MEIIYQHSDVLELIKEPIIVMVCIALIPLLILLLKKNISIEKSSKNEVRVAVIIVSCVVLLFFGSVYYKRIIFLADIISDNKQIMQTELPKLYADNTGIHFKKANIRYTFDFEYADADNLYEYFEGNLCEIEYYKLSRIVTRIKLVKKE